MDKKKKENFNIVIAGVGGQGLVTLNLIIAKACVAEGYDVKTSELHGLSQRNGSVETYIRFGKKIYSPLIAFGEADLVLGLEIAEGLRAFRFSNKNTKFLINKYNFSYLGGLPEKEILNKLEELGKEKLFLIPASEICRKELGKEVVSGVYLLGIAAVKKLIPLKPESILEAIPKVVPEKYLEINKKAFELPATNTLINTNDTNK